MIVKRLIMINTFISYLAGQPDQEHKKKLTTVDTQPTYMIECKDKKKTSKLKSFKSDLIPHKANRLNSLVVQAKILNAR